MERWKTKTIISDGGYDIVTSILEQGTLYPGTARRLINYEPAETRGYRKVLGYTKFDDDVVPGETNAPILGCYPVGSTALAVRKSTDMTPSYDIYLSTGSGWTKQNVSARTNLVTKARFTSYSFTEQVVIVTDGANPAFKYAASGNVALNSGGAPTNPKYATMVLSRLVLSGYSSNPSAITLSAPNNDTNFTAAAGAIELNVGDTVTGLTTFRETLYIFCESSIFRLEGSTSADFRIVAVTRKIGCLSGDTIQEIAGDIIFLAPDGLRSLAATERIGDVELGLQSTVIQPDILESIQGLPTQYSSITIPSKSQYRLFIYNSALPDLAQKGYIGKFKPSERKQYDWSNIQGFPAYSAGSVGQSESVTSPLIGHPSNGYVYQTEAGGSFDGQAIPFEYTTPPITFDDIEVLKIFYKLSIIAEADTDTSFNIRLILDEYENNAVAVQPASKVVNLINDVAIFDEAIFDTDVFALGARPLMDRLNIEGSGATLTIQITGSNTDLPHRIDGFSITYIDKSRKVGE